MAGMEKSGPRVEGGSLGEEPWGKQQPGYGRVGQRAIGHMRWNRAVHCALTHVSPARSALCRLQLPAALLQELCQQAGKLGLCCDTGMPQCRLPGWAGCRSYQPAFPHTSRPPRLSRPPSTFLHTCPPPSHCTALHCNPLHPRLQYDRPLGGMFTPSSETESAYFTQIMTWRNAANNTRGSTLAGQFSAGPAAVLGHSMGGGLAAILAGMHPTGVGAAVLLDPGKGGGGGAAGQTRVR